MSRPSYKAMYENELAINKSIRVDLLAKDQHIAKLKEDNQKLRESLQAWISTSLSSRNNTADLYKYGKNYWERVKFLFKEYGIERGGWRGLMLVHPADFAAFAKAEQELDDTLHATYAPTPPPPTVMDEAAAA